MVTHLLAARRLPLKARRVPFSLTRKVRIMLNAENEQDKERFEKLKEAEVERGRDDEQAIDVAARQVKELRKREGRSKEDDLAR